MKIYDLNELGVDKCDQRGWMVELADFAISQGFEIKNTHVGNILPGQIRGNHLHQKQTEWLLVFGGKALIICQEKGETVQKEITVDDKLLFEVEQGCAHAIKNIDEHEIFVLAITDQVYNPENPDRIFEKLVE